MKIEQLDGESILAHCGDNNINEGERIFVRKFQGCNINRRRQIKIEMSII